MKAVLKQPPKMVARLNKVKEYPQLEDLEITPSIEEQNFKSNMYGYDNVKVRAVESEEITITPSITDQVKEGMYNKVTVAGDSDLVAENIKEGINIFGVNGTAVTSNLQITDTRQLFADNYRLGIINDIVPFCKNVTQATRMFYNSYSLTSVDLRKFDAHLLTSIAEMFYNCSKLKTINMSGLNTSNVTDMGFVFNACSVVTSINLTGINTSKVKRINQMFGSCAKLVTLDLSGFDFGAVNSATYFLYGCSVLANLKSFKNFGKGFTSTSANKSAYELDLSSCTKLTHDSLLDIITNGLYDLNLTYDVANGGTLYTQKLVLGSTNMAKLTPEEINIAVQKGFSVS